MSVQRLKRVTFVVVGLLALSAAAFGAERIVIDEKFEGAPGTVPAGWEPTMDGDAKVSIVETDLDAPSGGTVLEVVDNSFIMAAMLERPFPGPVAHGAFEFVAYNTPDMPGEIYGEIRAVGVGTVMDCHISPGRVFKCRDEKSLYELVTDVERGVWHTVRIEWDTTTWTYKALLNGVDVTPEGGLRFAQHAVPTGIRFKLGSGPKVDQRAYIDSASVVEF